jgi:hypothetical protein
MPFKTPLEAAIAHLISKGIIKGNADVARDLGMKSRSTVTSYANGNLPISPKFQTMFEERYKIKLIDFNEALEQSARTPLLLDYKEKYISILEQQCKEKEELVVYKEKQIEILDRQIFALSEQIRSLTESLNLTVAQNQKQAHEMALQQVEIQKQMVVNRAYGKAILSVLEDVLHNQEPKKPMERIRSGIDKHLAVALGGGS